MQHRFNILVVDDTPHNLDIARNILHTEYRVRLATNGEIALKLIHKQKPDLILLDIMMPGMDGYEVCRQLKADPRYTQIPVIFVTAMDSREDEAKGLALGAVDYISKPINPSILKARVKTHIALYDQHRALEEKVNKRTKELYETRLQIIQNLGRAAEYKDNETGLHVIRMSNYAKLLAIHAGVPDEEVTLIYNAMPMHDVGKIGIPDHILLKPGPLTAEEWAIMQTHPQIGADIIGDGSHPLMNYARTISLTHHEKWDGSGYPNQLQGDQIPFIGRLAAIADVFDALTSERPYKKAWTIEDAVDAIHEGAGKHFDPALIPVFDSALDEIRQIQHQYKDKQVNGLKQINAQTA